MGNNLSLNSLSIGEIELSKDLSYAMISCMLPEATLVSLIVQDEYGRSKIEKKYSLDEGEQIVTIDICSLGNGSYNAWIDLMDKTFIRNFQIHKDDENGKWINKFKGFFK